MWQLTTTLDYTIIGDTDVLCKIEHLSDHSDKLLCVWNILLAKIKAFIIQKF